MLSPQFHAYSFRAEAFEAILKAPILSGETIRFQQLLEILYRLDIESRKGFPQISLVERGSAI